MNIYLDNIIFSLQEAGGISVVWKELLYRILNDPEFESSFIDLPNQNIFRNELFLPISKILKNTRQKYPLIFERYLNLRIKGKGIFHSSYYRIVKNPQIVNITTVHDFTYEHFRKRLPKVIHQIQKGNAIRNSERIICVSQNTKEDLLKFYPTVKENHIKVIYNGVNNNYRPLLQKEESFLKQMIPFSSGEFVIFIGERKSLYKNFKEAVYACQIAKSPLVIVGGGAITHTEYVFLKETLGKDNFKQLSGISNNQLNILYNHALCLLYPSFYEGFGIPIIEAQKAGCPVVSSSFSSIPEVAGEGAVLLKEVSASHISDTINQMKRNPLLVANLIEKGLKNSQRFSWDECYQQTKQLYKEVYEEKF